MGEIAIPDSFLRRPYAKEKFLAITNWAKQNHPFYRNWLSHADREVPLLTRTDVLENNEKLLNGYPVTATTSGSTGVPVKVSWSKRRQKIEELSINRLIGWLGGRMPVTRFIHSENPDGENFDVSTPVADQLALILKRYRLSGAVAITTYPSNAERICKEVRDKGLDMSFIRRFGVFAEVFEPPLEELIKQTFPNAQIWSSYSCQEAGLIAGRCPHNPGCHHVMFGKLGIEILDDSNKPCPEGVVGRVVITDYFNLNAPLIRYDIGDLAAWGQCTCGKITNPSLSVIHGKIRGALLHKNGERIPFINLSIALRDIQGMRQYQVIQNTIDQFDVKVVYRDNNVTSTLHEQIGQAFYNHFGYTTEINLHLESEIKREANGKFYASICKL
ncbi:hypothetical protein ACFL20_09875 [Spirochaetota bacterium]